MNLTANELLRLLPRREAIVLRRRFLRGETLQRAGDALGVTRAGAKAIQQRGLRRLRAMLGDREALLEYLVGQTWGLASNRMWARHHGAAAMTAAMLYVLDGMSDDELRELAEVL